MRLDWERGLWKEEGPSATTTLASDENQCMLLGLAFVRCGTVVLKGQKSAKN